MRLYVHSLQRECFVKNHRRQLHALCGISAEIQRDLIHGHYETGVCRRLTCEGELGHTELWKILCIQIKVLFVNLCSAARLSKVL